MQSLKKYFTEGLIQVAILLSLAGIRVDVDPYLPPLREIIQGQSSALTQAQFHNLRNSLDGYGLHPKNVDLDGFFTTRRLLRWVRSLDHLQVPASQLETWLVHREPEGGMVTMTGQVGALDGDNRLANVEESTGLAMRMGGGGMAELGFNPDRDESLADSSLLSTSQMENEDVKEEMDELLLWHQEPNHVEPEQVHQGQNQHLSLLNDDDEDALMVDRWRNANPFHNPMTTMLNDVQFAGLQGEPSLSIEDCLQLLETNLPQRDQQHLEDHDMGRVDEDPLQLGSFLLSPSTFNEPLLDLEEQWQDALAIMEPQDMDVDEPLSEPDSIANITGRTLESTENSVHQNISFRQSTLSNPNQNFWTSNNTHQDVSRLSSQNQTSQLATNSSPITDLNLNDNEIIDFLLSPAQDRSIYNDPNLDTSPMEDQSLSSLFGPLLEDAMFDEISLLDLAMEEGLIQAEVSQNVEQDHTDSDSGLSLDFSQSPASPSGSESSCSSSSSSSCSSSSVSSTESAPEDGAVGYTHIKEEPTDDDDDDDEEEGAVGGYSPDQNKMFQTNYLEPGQFRHLPWLEHIGHDHTYNQPHFFIQRKSPKQRSEEHLEADVQDSLSTRDEKRAHAMKIPFSNDIIVNLPVEKFNELLAKYRLSEAQLTLIRDIRRRGKNKMAAQNCRRRKLDVLQELERSVEGLRRHRTRLLREKSEVLRSVREMKQRLNDLYQEIYVRLREEQGMLCSAGDFALQQDNASHVSFSTKHGSQNRRKSGKRQKDKD